MDIQVVDIRKIAGNGGLRAYADVKLGSQLIAKGFAVMEGKNGVFVKMPARPGKDGKWFDVVTPVNEDFKLELEEKVLEAYDRETDGA